MNGNAIRRAQRRERLIAQAASQRLLLAQNIAPLRRPLALADHALAALRLVRRHPAWFVGGVLFLAARPPGRAGKWLRRGWITWQIVHELRSG